MGLLQSFSKKEEHGHHHQGHVVMPRHPTPRLILIHPRFVLGVLEDPLDPISLPLNVGKAHDRRFRGGVAQTVLAGAWRTRLASQNQVPSSRCALSPLTHPDTLMERLDLKLSLR